MGMSSPVFHSSLSAAHLVFSSHPQNFRLQPEHLAGTNSWIPTQEDFKKHINISYRHIQELLSHIYTNLFWARANISPTSRPAVNIYSGKDSKLSVNMVTPFL